MTEIIIFPTDTVYGIGTGILNNEGIKKIYELKGRNFAKPMAVLCADLKQIEEFAIVTKEAKLLAKQFWPGAITLILNTNEKYRKKTLEKTIGVRIPNHKKTLELLKKYGPLKTTSVNEAGEEPLNDFEVIKARYQLLVDKIYDNDEPIIGVSSTVINLTDNLFVIREGSITIDDINECLKSLK